MHTLPTRYIQCSSILPFFRCCCTLRWGEYSDSAQNVHHLAFIFSNFFVYYALLWSFPKKCVASGIGMITRGGSLAASMTLAFLLFCFREYYNMSQSFKIVPPTHTLVTCPRQYLLSRSGACNSARALRHKDPSVVTFGACVQFGIIQTACLRPTIPPKALPQLQTLKQKMLKRMLTAFTRREVVRTPSRAPLTTKQHQVR